MRIDRTAFFYLFVALLAMKANIALACNDLNANCVAWARAGSCKTHRSYMLTNCRQSCRFCTDPPRLTTVAATTLPADCQDENSYCSAYKAYCTDPGYIDYLQQQCKRTCNYCHITTAAPPTTVYVSTLPYTGAGGRALQPGCGHKGPGHTRIVGGKNAKAGDWPWQVNIDYEKNVNNPGNWCGGSLITDEWVLTAAHCFYDDQNKTRYWLRLGEHNLKENSTWEQRFDFEELLLHPQYKPQGQDYDLALVKLSRKATLNERVRTVCLPGQNTSFPTGKSCYISGWGLLKEFGTGPQILQQAQVPLVDRGTCQKAFTKLAYSVTDRMFCAGYETGGIDSCEGDSGGPLVCEEKDPVTNEETWYLWGVISWGVGCARKGLFGVLADVKYLRPWVDKIVFNM